MRIARFALMAAAALSFAAPASAQSFVGEWKATAKTRGGEVSEMLTVTESDDGYSITARPVIEPPAGTPQAGPGTEIVLDGDKFSFRRVIELPNDSLNINYSGVVDGDTFSGTVEIEGIPDTVPYTGVRVGADESPEQ